MRIAVVTPEFAECGSRCASRYLAQSDVWLDGRERAEVRGYSDLGTVPGAGELDALVLDAGNSRSELLVTRARALRPATPVLGIVCGSPARAVAPIDAFDDVLICPTSEHALRLRLERWARKAHAPHRPEPPATPADTVLVGESPSFRAALGRVEVIAEFDATVLVQGDTGTGKELFARAVHYRSRRADKPFIPVNCGALPDALFENELFGHERGAYTGASSRARGLLAEAEGGTLFLDEVDSLSPASQVKLLRFLQDHSFRPLGSAKASRADVRVVAATNTDLWGRVRGGGFREDLYFRLNVLPMSVPALRDRGRDVLVLAGHFLEMFAADMGRPVPRMTPDLEAAMLGYDWPGNVREVEAFVQRALVFCPGTTLSLDRVNGEVIDLRTSARGALVAERAPSRSSVGFDEGRRTALEQFERAYLTSVLTLAEGNVSRAAREAGKDRRTIQRLLRKHDLDRRQFHRE